MNKRFFEIAEKASILSTHPKHKMAAVLVKKNKIISIGVNQLKTHPKAPTPYNTIHCEFHSVINSKLNDFSDCSIYIYRKTPGGRMANSKPCFSCEKMLYSISINKIYYSDDNGFKKL